MTRSLTFSAAVVIALGMASPVLAAPRPVDPERLPAGQDREGDHVFEDDHLDGEVLRLPNPRTMARRAFDCGSLFRIRRDFVPELTRWSEGI